MRISSKRGMAMLELIPIIIVMFLLLGGALGAWGIAHTAILNSISARNYAFFLFNNRSDLSYFKDFGPSGDFPAKSYFRSDLAGGGPGMKGKRFHFIASEEATAGQDDPPTTKRFPAFSKTFLKECNDSNNDLTPAKHNTSKGWWKEIGWWEGKKWQDGNPRHDQKACPPWIMVGYGICLDANCGD